MGFIGGGGAMTLHRISHAARHLQKTSKGLQKSFHTDGQVHYESNNNKPIEFSTSKASKHSVEKTFGYSGRTGAVRPVVLGISLFCFIMYMCYVRGENDGGLFSTEIIDKLDKKHMADE